MRKTKIPFWIELKKELIYILESILTKFRRGALVLAYLVTAFIKMIWFMFGSLQPIKIVFFSSLNL